MRGTRAQEKAGATPRSNLNSILRNYKKGRQVLIENYFQAGLRPEEAKEWAGSGFSAEEVLEFIDASISAKEAKQILKEELTQAKEDSKENEDKIKILKRKGIKESDARLWIENGFSPEDVQDYKQVLRNTRKLEFISNTFPNFVSPLIKDRFKDMRKWNDAGINRANGISPVLVMELLHNTNRLGRYFSSPDDYVLLKKDGLPAEEISTLLRKREYLNLYKNLKAENLPIKDCARVAAFQGTWSAVQLAEWTKEFPHLSKEDLLAFNKKEITLKDYKQWQDYPDPCRAALFIEAGIDQKEAKKWDQINSKELFDHEKEHLYYLKENGVSAQEALNYLQEIRDKDFVKYPYSPDYKDKQFVGRMVRYSSYGPVEELTEWDKNFVHTKYEFNVDTIQKFKEKEVASFEAKEWYMVSKDSPVTRFCSSAQTDIAEQIGEFKKMGMQAADYHQLIKTQHNYFLTNHGKRNIGLHDYPQLVEHVKIFSDTSTKDICEWWENNLSNNLQEVYQIKQTWQEKGFSLQEAKKWNTSSFKQKDIKGQVERAFVFKENKITPRQAAKWKDFTAEEASQWITAGVKDPKEAGYIKENGLLPQQKEGLKDYKKEGFTDKEALQWSASGFSAEKAKEWQVAGILDPSVALSWQKASVTPQKAKEYEQQRKARLQK